MDTRGHWPAWPATKMDPWCWRVQWTAVRSSLTQLQARWACEQMWDRKKTNRSSCELEASFFMFVCMFLKVVGSFSADGGKAKGSKDEDEETNSVESVGFCNMWVATIPSKSRKIMFSIINISHHLSLQSASLRCSLLGWDSGHIWSLLTGPEAQMPTWGKACVYFSFLNNHTVSSSPFCSLFLYKRFVVTSQISSHHVREAWWSWGVMFR